METATLPQMLKPKQVAKILNCSYDHALELMGSEKMKAIDIAKEGASSRMFRITPKHLQEYIEGRA